MKSGWQSVVSELIRNDAGPKDIVIIGRVAGRLTGKAVGYIQSARGHITPLMQRSEITTVCDSPLAPHCVSFLVAVSKHVGLELLIAKIKEKQGIQGLV